MNTLKAEKRDLAVKAKKLRREGYVTGNVFGKELVSIPWLQSHSIRYREPSIPNDRAT